ncbi:hypothetical protein Tco_1194254 [Tanacetum coccineum]
MGNRIRTRNSPDMFLEMILQFEFLSKKCVDEVSECSYEFNTRLFQSITYLRFLYSNVLHKSLEDKSAIPISVIQWLQCRKVTTHTVQTDNVQTGRYGVSIEPVFKLDFFSSSFLFDTLHEPSAKLLVEEVMVDARHTSMSFSPSVIFAWTKGDEFFISPYRVSDDREFFE